MPLGSSESTWGGIQAGWQGDESAVYTICVYVCVVGLRELKGGASDPDLEAMLQNHRKSYCSRQRILVEARGWGCLGSGLGGSGRSMWGGEGGDLVRGG